MLIAGMRAIFEDDIKKIIALSTLRQLGVMIIILGLHRPVLAYYHLILHAYFKAMLFICAGYYSPYKRLSRYSFNEYRIY